MKKLALEIANLTALHEPLGWTSLHVMAQTPNTPSIEPFVEPIQIDQPDIFGRTPLHIAVQAGLLSHVAQLIDYGANINAIDRSGWSALHMAAQANHIHIVQLLIHCNAHLDQQITGGNNRGYTALFLAIAAGHHPVIKLLLQHSADLNNIKDFYGDTLLHLTAKLGDLQTTDLLVHHGIDLDAGAEGWTPLHRAAAAGHYAIVKRLLESGAHPDPAIQPKPWYCHTNPQLNCKQEARGPTPLLLATEEINIHITTLQQQGHHSPLLRQLAQNNHIDIIQLLTETNLSALLKTKRNRVSTLFKTCTPYTAIEKRIIDYMHIINLLMQYNANPHQADSYDMTPVKMGRITMTT